MIMKKLTNNLAILAKGFCILLFIAITTPIMAQEYIARLAWVNRTELTTPVAGVVDVVHVEAGMKVNKGDHLVTLEPMKFEIQIKESQSQLNKRAALLDEARRELDRAQGLYDRTLLSEHELQVVKNAYITSNADFDLAKAKLAQAKLDYEYSRLRAPFDAVVLKRLAEKGMVVMPQLQPQTLVIIAHGHKMLAQAKINASDLLQIQSGQVVDIIIRGEKYRGEVKYKGMEPVIENGTEYNLDIEFSTNGKQFIAGQQARIVF